MSDDESDEEESSSNHYTDHSEFFFVISSLWIERDKHINTDYAVNIYIYKHFSIFSF